MATARATKQSAPRRHLPPAEKRRIVELTLRSGISIRANASEHGVHPNSLRRWQALYLAGELGAVARSASRVDSRAASATFVPVTIVPAIRGAQPATRSDPGACGRCVVELVLASGASLRIESDALDASLICALVAELRR